MQLLVSHRVYYFSRFLWFVLTIIFFFLINLGYFGLYGMHVVERVISFSISFVRLVGFSVLLVFVGLRNFSGPPKEALLLSASCSADAKVLTVRSPTIYIVCI